LETAVHYEDTPIALSFATDVESAALGVDIDWPKRHELSNAKPGRNEEEHASCDCLLVRPALTIERYRPCKSYELGRVTT
jgi:hypothetical protein